MIIIILHPAEIRQPNQFREWVSVGSGVNEGVMDTEDVSCYWNSKDKLASYGETGTAVINWQVMVKLGSAVVTDFRPRVAI